MSTPHLADAQIERYRSRTLPAEELFAAIDHIFACDICHRRLVGEDPVDHTYRFVSDELRAAALERSDHLRFEQIIAYAYGQLGEADCEILETHIEECPECDAEVADARLFRAALHLIPPRGPAPSTERKRQWLPSDRRSLYQLPLQVAAVILVAVLTARFATALLTSKMDKLATEVSQLRASNDYLSMQLAERSRTSPVGSPEASASDQSIGHGPPLSPDSTDNKAPAPAITVKDGGRTLRLDSSGVLESGGLLSAKYMPLVASALHTGHLSTPSALLAPLRSQTRSASENDAFRLIAPVGEVAISDRPVFRWTPLSEARSYSVLIRDASSDEQVEGNAVSGTQWVPEKTLERGHTYSWAVVATLQEGKRLYVPGTGSPAALFTVLDKSASDEVEAATTTPNRSHLLLAVLYARYGLIAEAAKEINALQAENPKSTVITRLQRSLNSNPRR